MNTGKLRESGPLELKLKKVLKLMKEIDDDSTFAKNPFRPNLLDVKVRAFAFGYFVGIGITEIDAHALSFDFALRFSRSGGK